MPVYSAPSDPSSLDPAVLAAQLRARIQRAEAEFAAIGEEKASLPLAPGKWSIKQVFGDLCDSAMNNQQRLVRLQLQETLDLPGYEQEGWVQVQRYDLLPWPTVFSLWKTLNEHFAHSIEHADAAAFTHTWQFEGKALPLGFILEDYMGHLDHHLRALGL